MLISKHAPGMPSHMQQGHRNPMPQLLTPHTEAPHPTTPHTCASSAGDRPGDLWLLPPGSGSPPAALPSCAPPTSVPAAPAVVSDGGAGGGSPSCSGCPVRKGTAGETPMGGRPSHSMPASGEGAAEGASRGKGGRGGEAPPSSSADMSTMPSSSSPCAAPRVPWPPRPPAPPAAAAAVPAGKPPPAAAGRPAPPASSITFWICHTSIGSRSLWMTTLQSARMAEGQEWQ